LAEQDVFMVKKLEHYRAWMREDDRIAGVFGWHWGAEPISTTLRAGYTIGMQRLPKTIAMLQDMAKETKFVHQKHDDQEGRTGSVGSAEVVAYKDFEGPDLHGPDYWLEWPMDVVTTIIIQVPINQARECLLRQCGSAVPIVVRSSAIKCLIALSNLLSQSGSMVHAL
jgi:hypothetical protein